MLPQETTAPARRGRPPRARVASLLGPDHEIVQQPPAASADPPGQSGKPDRPREDSRAFPPPTEISEQLFTDNVRLAYMIARRWEKRTRMPFETLKPSALIGLLRAARKYDPNKINPKNGGPYALSSHSVPFIDGEIKHFLRKNHASGVIFPERWRDTAPKVKQLLSEGLTPEQVGQQTGFSADEVREIIEAQSSIQELDLDARGYAHLDPELTDDEIDSCQLLEAMQIADQAWMAMDYSLQQIMVQSWEGYGRRNRPELAIRSYDRFAKFARAIRSGHDLPRGIRQPTLDLVITDDDGSEHLISSPGEIAEALEQMALKLSD